MCRDRGPTRCPASRPFLRRVIGSPLQRLAHLGSDSAPRRVPSGSHKNHEWCLEFRRYERTCRPSANALRCRGRREAWVTWYPTLPTRVNTHLSRWHSSGSRVRQTAPASLRFPLKFTSCLGNSGLTLTRLPNAPGKEEPAEEKGGATDRGDCTEPANAGKAQKIETTGENDGPGHEEPARRRDPASRPPTSGPSHCEQGQSMIHLVAH